MSSKISYFHTPWHDFIYASEASPEAESSLPQQDVANLPLKVPHNRRNLPLPLKCSGPFLDKPHHSHRPTKRTNLRQNLCHRRACRLQLDYSKLSTIQPRLLPLRECTLAINLMHNDIYSCALNSFSNTAEAQSAADVFGERCAFNMASMTSLVGGRGKGAAEYELENCSDDLASITS